MGNHQVTRNVDDDLSKPGHTCLLIRSSGDDYKSVTMHCIGNANPHAEQYDGHLVDDTPDDCGWSGPNIRAGRWHEKHIEDAWAGHLAYVAEHGPIEHGVQANFPQVCRCYDCRNGHRPGEPW